MSLCFVLKRYSVPCLASVKPMYSISYYFILLYFVIIICIIINVIIIILLFFLFLPFTFPLLFVSMQVPLTYAGTANEKIIRVTFSFTYLFKESCCSGFVICQIIQLSFVYFTVQFQSPPVNLIAPRGKKKEKKVYSDIQSAKWWFD